MDSVITQPDKDYNLFLSGVKEIESLIQKGDGTNAMDALCSLLNTHDLDEDKILAVLNMLHNLHQSEIGLSLCQQWGKRYPQSDKVLRLEGNFYMQAYMVKDAHVCFKKAYELNNTLSNAYNYGLTERWMGSEDKAVQLLKSYLGEHSLKDSLEHVLATVLLQQGKLEEGFRYYESRISAPFYQAYKDAFKAPFWSGQDIEGKSVLLFSDQGIGDTIQFARYIGQFYDLMKQKKASKVLIFVHYEIRDILQHNYQDVPVEWLNAADIFDLPNQIDIAKIDYLVGFLSLGWHMRISSENVIKSHNTAYIKPTDHAKHKWQARVAQEALPNKIRVGIFWAGAARQHAMLQAIDGARSINPNQLSPLLMTENVNFFAMQFDRRLDYIPTVAINSQWIDLMDEVESFDDTAGILSALDILITVDASIAHMAGAMGMPVWMLNRSTTCWRWGKSATHSPWYDDFKIIRQQYYNDWKDPIAIAAENLTRVILKHQL